MSLAYLVGQSLGPSVEIWIGQKMKGDVGKGKIVEGRKYRGTSKFEGEDIELILDVLIFE